MFNEMNNVVAKFDKCVLAAVKPKYVMMGIVEAEWEYQHKLDMGVDLNPDNCEGMTQLQIDATVAWLRDNGAAS